MNLHLLTLRPYGYTDKVVKMRSTGVPSCGTGPLARWSFVAREMREVLAEVRTALRRHTEPPRVL